MNDSTSRASLFLMELMLSILFFSLSAVVCVQLFVKSHTLSRQSVKLNHAVIASESMAEAFYSSDGNLSSMQSVLEGSVHDQDTISMYFGEEFELIPAPGSDFDADKNEKICYVLTGKTVPLNDTGLIKLSISYTERASSEVIYSLNPELFPVHRSGLSENSAVSGDQSE